jgi:CheY-like chemotaxis protein
LTPPGVTILLADDDPLILELGRHMLEAEGFQTVAVRSGREAVDLYRRRADDIACVLLDLNMPDMGGEAALAEIRGVRADARVVLLSGYGGQDFKAEFVAKGAVTCVQKPFRPADLLDAVRKALESD